MASQQCLALNALVYADTSNQGCWSTSMAPLFADYSLLIFFLDSNIPQVDSDLTDILQKHK